MKTKYYRKLLTRGILLGIGVAIGISTVALFSVSIGTLHTFSTGTPVSSSKINENFANLKTAVEGINDVPIGTIVAWHESLAGVPSLPTGWVRCNGQTLSDSLSPLNGQIIPNLNGQKNSWNSKGVFLRGSASSGTFEDDSFQGHWHEANTRNINLTIGYGGTLMEGQSDYTNYNKPGVNGPITDGVNGTPRFGSETRPVNMSVVWIMRMK